MRKVDNIFRGVGRAIAFSEAGAAPPERVELIRCGTFSHDKYGVFKITPEVLKSFKKNFDDRARGIDLAVDYKHASEAEAAGWFKSLELAENDTILFANVDWTPKGGKVLSEKEFRYISADFQLDYKDNETLKSFGPTLMGAGLTNRPVIKRMDPVIELSEGKGNTMDPKDQQIADLQKQLEALKAAASSKEVEFADMKKKFDESNAAKLAADKSASDSKEALAMSEKKGQFDKMLSEGKVCEAQRVAFMGNDTIKFAELAQPTNGGKGSGGTPPDAVTPKDAGEAQEQIHKLAEEKVNKKEAKDYRSAVSMVLSEKPDLRAKAYA